jgi:hypothetical protein
MVLDHQKSSGLGVKRQSGQQGLKTVPVIRRVRQHQAELTAQSGQHIGNAAYQQMAIPRTLALL